MSTVKQEDIYDNTDRLILENCTLCPRECRVNRFEGGTGYCGTDAGMNIASICIHKGEEPVISGEEGICNIFFQRMQSSLPVLSESRNKSVYWGPRK